MTITARLDEDLAAAMRARDAVRLSALRLLKTALTNRSLERGHALSEAEEFQVVQALAKQRHDSIDQFTRAGRTDLVEKERAELGVLESYLPPPLDDAALEAAVDAAIAETGAVGAKDMGRVMKASMARLSERAVDGKRLSELVRQKLARG